MLGMPRPAQGAQPGRADRNVGRDQGGLLFGVLCSGFLFAGGLGCSGSLQGAFFGRGSGSFRVTRWSWPTFALCSAVQPLLREFEPSRAVQKEKVVRQCMWKCVMCEGSLQVRFVLRKVVSQIQEIARSA